jgi:hypothetical protein
MMIYQPSEKMVTFREEMIKSVSHDREVIAKARKIMKPDQELVMVRWGRQNEPMHVWLSQNDTIYVGTEAGAIFRKTFYINSYSNEMPDLAPKEGDRPQKAVPLRHQLASKTRTRVGVPHPPEEALTLAEIAEGLEKYVTALRALVEGS